MNDQPREGTAFAQFLAGLQDGELHADLSAALAAGIATMQEQAATYGGKPTLKIALAIELTLSDGMVEARADFDTKTSKPPRRRSMYWPTDQGGLARNNPRQREMPLRDVNTGAAREIR